MMSNIMRREIDPIMLVEYIGILGAGYEGRGANQYALHKRKASAKG